MTKQEIRIDRI